MVTALLDRLTHHCHIVKTGNESYRLQHNTFAARQRAAERLHKLELKLKGVFVFENTNLVVRPLLYRLHLP